MSRLGNPWASQHQWMESRKREKAVLPGGKHWAENTIATYQRRNGKFQHNPVGMQLGYTSAPSTVSYNKGGFVLNEPSHMYRPEYPKKKSKAHDPCVGLLGHPKAQRAPLWGSWGYDSVQAKGIERGMGD